MKSKRKLPPIIILTIITSSLVVLFLTISIITSVLLVKRCEHAIEDIGDVTYNAEVEEKIDLANGYYNKLDKNISLDERVYNKDDLANAKYNYVRLAIKKALVSYNRRIVDKISEDEIKENVNSANKALEKYYVKDNFEAIEGYNEFKALLEIYKEEEKTNNNSSSSEPKAEEPEIC